MVSRGKTEKISVTLPRELAGEIRSVIPRGEVSLFFTEALQHYIAYRKQKIALEKGFGAWGDKCHPDLAGPKDATTYVQSIRKAGKKRQEHLGDSIAK